ncbi:ClpP/crotonase [Viridothelium virens]|uniref:ClpP/crotonase n=1 Tax=Viridothelium virens TaxID=1048519 RepID=A0A6A6HG33_VIRVR|nr:ClpP/crotonase [Viridothelium virens]
MSSFLQPAFRHANQSLMRWSRNASLALPKRSFSSTVTRPLRTDVEYKPDDADSGKIAHLSFFGDKKFPIASRDSMQTLLAELESIEGRQDVFALIIRSTFVGADLDGLRCLQGPRDAKSFIKVVDNLCSKLQDFRIPVISVIDGPCMGAGMELAAACDLRYATSSATFAMPETRLGMPSVVQASLMPGLIGWGRARELLYLGDVYDAHTMQLWGFVNKVFGRSEMEHAVIGLEQKLAQLEPKALATQKALMRVWEKRGTERAGIDASIDAFTNAFVDETATKKIRAVRTAMKTRQL